MKSRVNADVPARQQCVLKLKYINDALYVLNGKWKFPLISTLREGPLRFNEILQLVEGITPKVLAKELRELEINGLIERKVYPTMPVTIMYEASSYSDTLETVLNELGQWGKQHSEKIRQDMRDHMEVEDKQR
jgi:DNA-binding HxlR family transcriptional regulator